MTQRRRRRRRRRMMASRSDDEEDRQLDHNLVGLKIRIFYDDQGKWYDGQITWFNKKMGQVRIYFEEDDTDDHIEETEINGVDVILLP